MFTPSPEIRKEMRKQLTATPYETGQEFPVSVVCFAKSFCCQLLSFKSRKKFLFQITIFFYLTATDGEQISQTLVLSKIQLGHFTGLLLFLKSKAISSTQHFVPHSSLLTCHPISRKSLCLDGLDKYLPVWFFGVLAFFGVVWFYFNQKNQLI